MQHCPSCGCSLSRYETLVHGNVTVSSSSEIFYCGENLHLGGNIRILIDALIRAQGRPLARDTLLNIVGGEEYSDRTIDTYMCRARLAFLKINPKFDQIVCVRGLGYRWRREELPQEALRLVA